MEYCVSSAAYSGEYHRRQGEPCQDKVYVARENGVVCAALSDGAGSRPYSHIGAALVTETVAKFLVKYFDWSWEAEHELLSKKIIQLGIEVLDGTTFLPDAMACTLLCYAAHFDGRHISIHIGDGVIIVDDEGVDNVLSHPENGLYRNETVFITDPDAEAHLRIQKRTVVKIGGVLLMSDGIGDSLYHHQTAQIAPACKRIFRWLENGDEERVNEVLVMHMEELFSKQSSDDLSLIIVTWKE